MELIITLAGEPQGKLIREVTPTASAVTVREHQAFVALPDSGYKPRIQDPRASFFSLDFMDFSSPIDQPVERRYIVRHRLGKKGPTAAVSDPVKPIIYYVDSGAPEPVRSALLEGASWWNQAFEAAGFSNAFGVRVLSPDIDPMDSRYNVIQWVHRATRGWSYGNALMDPRTGEIIKGIVTLGSLRAHQDFLIFEGLMAPYTAPDSGTGPLNDLVLARLRQLAAHEVGHTLGLEHNYIASAQGRASVMDYPGPQVDIRPDNTLDFSKTYATGIGAWDKVSITWGYSEFTPGSDKHAALNKVISIASTNGLTFVTDEDSRPLGSAHPKSHLWDNGSNAVDERNRILKVCAAALSNFGERNIRFGSPMATLDEVLVPLYFMHRYQTEAAAKSIGGNEYTYALRGDGQPITKIVPPAEQRRTLEAVLTTLHSSTLMIPERVLNLIPPRPPSYPRTRETFPTRTGLTFDPEAGAEAAASLTVSLLLNPQRAARLDQYHARDTQNPGFGEVLAKLEETVWHSSPAVSQRVKYVVLNSALVLAADSSASAQVRSEAMGWLDELRKRLNDAYLNQQLEVLRNHHKELELPPPVEAPPGQPIGESCDW